MYINYILSILVLQTTFVLLSILSSFKNISFQIGLASIHKFINKSLPCK